MVNLELIKQKLPENLRDIAQSFDIPDDFLEKNHDLVILVLNSRSLAKNEEKQSWFNLVPVMNEDQINKLRGILEKEKEKIEEIENKYEQKKQEIKKKYQEKFDAVNYNKKMERMRDKEEDIREKEIEEADSLLDNI